MMRYTDEEIARAAINKARDNFSGVGSIDLTSIGGLGFRVRIWYGPAEKNGSRPETVELRVWSSSVTSMASRRVDESGITGWHVKELLEECRRGMARECRLIMEA